MNLVYVHVSLVASTMNMVQWDFKAIPMAPLGVPIITHDKPAERASWANHGTDGFYIGFAPNIIDASKYLSLPPTVHESRTQ